MSESALFPASRLEDAAERVRAGGLDALLLTPGADLRYVTGYDAKQLERLTCLVIPARGEPSLVVPRLELAAAQASPASGLGLEMIAWEETEDPYALIARRLGPVEVVGLADQMWALMVLRLRDAMPGARQVLASSALRELRMRKSPAEVAALREAAAAIDRVHARVPGWLKAGRTEREVGTLIAEAILAEGHTQVDFVIVGSGPNAASPHHEVSDRVLRPGDAVVVDIGGMMPSGYRSDCTRTYAIGEPPAGLPRLLPGAEGRAGGGVPGRPAGRARRGRRRRGPGADRPGRVRRGVHPPHRARHRPGVTRGSLHRGGQHRAARPRHGVLDRAGHLSRAERGAHRGHRGVHRERRRAPEQRDPRPHPGGRNGKDCGGTTGKGQRSGGVSPRPCCSARNRSNWAASSSAVGICSPFSRLSSRRRCRLQRARRTAAPAR